MYNYFSDEYGFKRKMKIPGMTYGFPSPPEEAPGP